MSPEFRNILAALSFALLSLSLPAQTDSLLNADTVPSGIHKGRMAGVLITQGAVYAASLTGLYYLWYADYPQSSFHFFNDNNEWLQMDKVGHGTAAYYICRVGYASYRWAGMDRKKAAWAGGLLGFAYMANIEILDAFSSEWGFSTGDMIANTAGCALFISQQLVWEEQRFLLKYSFHPTKYADYNPDLLGENFVQQMVKDYNGMTFWLSGNISSFLPKESRFPKWLNIAFGYGAEGMTGANSNEVSGSADFDRYRQFYLSLDIDLTRIPTRSKFLNGVFSVVNFIKIPCPAVEFNTLGKVRFHPLYF